MSEKYCSDSPTRRGNYMSRYPKDQSSRYERMPDERRQDSYNPGSGYDSDQKSMRDSSGYYQKGQDPGDPMASRRSQYPPSNLPRYDDPNGRRPPQRHSPSNGAYDTSEPRRRMSRFDTDASAQPASYPPRGPEGYPPQQPYGDPNIGPPNSSRQFRDAPRESRHHEREERGGSGYPRSGRSNPYDSVRSEKRDFRRFPPYSRLDNNADPNQQTIIDFIADTCFVSNLPLDATIAELADRFGSIGLIKTDKRTGLFRIKIYTTPEGAPKGEASITYEDPHAANAAIEWFNGTDFRGNQLKVQQAERTYSASYIANKAGRQDFRGGPPRGRGGDRGRYAPDEPQRHEKSDYRSQPDRRGSPPRQSPGMGRGGSQKPHFAQPGDWQCQFCKNNNFAWRTSCNRCNAPKSDESQGGGNVSSSTTDNRNMMSADPRAQDRFRERDPRS